MPVQKCTKNGKSGHRWGKSGKCYTGPGSRAKAERQGRAIEANKGEDPIVKHFKSNQK